MFDGTDTGGKEISEGDTSHVLVVHQMCLTPHVNRDEWVRNNIFQFTLLFCD